MSALACCGDRSSQASAHVTIGGPFALTDHFGARVTESTFRGKLLIVFFGFTHCRVVCPRALARIEAALERLGSAADECQPLYITVDPDRDKPDVMRRFLEKSFPRILGLTGTAKEIEATKARFFVHARRSAGALSEGTDYEVPHTSFTYLMGRDARYVRHFTDAVTADELTDALCSLLAEGS